MPDAQGDDGIPQLPSAHPPLKEGLASETANAENCFSIFWLPHSHWGTCSLLRINISLTLPQSVQRYSKIGMFHLFTLSCTGAQQSTNQRPIEHACPGVFRNRTGASGTAYKAIIGISQSRAQHNSQSQADYGYSPQLFKH